MTPVASENISLISLHSSQDSQEIHSSRVQPTTIEGHWKPERVVIIELPERKEAGAVIWNVG
jgi:hypothetical protein